LYAVIARRRGRRLCWSAVVRCWSTVFIAHLVVHSTYAAGALAVIPLDTAPQGFRVWKLCTFSLNFAFCVHPCVPLWGPVCLSMCACLYVSSDTCCPRRWQRRHQRRLHVLWPHMLACFRVSLAVEIVDECACLSDYVRAMRNYVCSCVHVCVYVVCFPLYPSCCRCSRCHERHLHVFCLDVA
jgi:hypothetical protein